MSERALWVDVGAGTLKADWVWIVVRYRNGRPDFSTPPRWATERDVRRPREPEPRVRPRERRYGPRVAKAR